jgi:hypothetical protein
MSWTICINAKLISWATCQGVYNILCHPHMGWTYSANGQHLFQRVVILLALQYSTWFTKAVVGKVLQISIASLPLLILHYEWHTLAFQQAKCTGVINIKLTVNNYLRFRHRFLKTSSTKHNTSHTTAAMTLHQGCQAIGHSPWNSTRPHILKFKGTRIIHNDHIYTSYPIAYFGKYKTANPERYDWRNTGVSASSNSQLLHLTVISNCHKKENRKDRTN